MRGYGLRGQVVSFSMRLRPLISLGCTFLCAFALAQDDGIGDPTFPTLGNKGYKATHYLLKLNYDPETAQLKANVTMEGVVDPSPLSTLSVDFSGFTVSAVKLNGASATFTRSGAKLRVKPASPLAAGSKFALETIYSGKPELIGSAALPPIYKGGWVAYPGGAVAACEPDMSHGWFPCNDHPLNKATFDVEITAPRPYVTVSNGIGKTIGPTTTHFTLDKPALTCMVTVAVGKYGILKQVGPNSLPITNYVPLGTETQYIEPLQVTPKFIQYLSDRIGPYPFASYGTITFPDEASKSNKLLEVMALETTSIPLFSPGSSKDAATLCHELTHQWMGDCVSVTNWGDDIWWVEGFAQYSEFMLAEMNGGKAAYDAAIKAAYASVSAQSHWLKPGHLPAADMFSLRSYIGGALTFHALRKKLGDEKFFQVVRQFVDKHRYGNASVKDWIEIATQVAGEDMKPFFDTWLYGDAVPKLPS